jgi:quercetin dioxygenase-like cupin family protein
MYTIHEKEVEAMQLPGRSHKMIIGPDNFGDIKNMCFGVADFPPGVHAPGHVHDIQEEIIYVLSGKGRIYIGEDEPEQLIPGTCVYIPVGKDHSIENTGHETLKVVYVFSPPAKQGSYDKK